MKVVYQENLDGIAPDKLGGFFVGWPSPPSKETFFQLLRESYAVVIALNSASGNVAGFISAISDGVLCAYIPLLEVRPEYRKMGIGSELTARMLKRLEGLYMIDLVCDAHLESFYGRFGLSPMHAMIRRNYSAQAGRQAC